VAGSAHYLIHVECSAPNEASKGLDGKKDARIWISWTCAGKTGPDGKPDKTPAMVSVPVFARDAHGGEGHDAVDIAESLAVEIKSQWGKGVSPTEAAQVGISTKEVPHPAIKRTGKKARLDSFAKVDFVNVDEIDAGSCHGKVEIYAGGELFDPKHPTHPPVRRTPIKVAIEEKQKTDPEFPERCPPPGLREPDDPKPKAPKSYPSATTGDWDTVYARTRVITPSDPPSGGSKSKSASPGSEGTPPKTHRQVRPVPVPSGVPGMGVFRLACGSAMDADNLRWLTVPWLIDYESREHQLQHMADCISIAGIECYLFNGCLYISHNRLTGLPVIAFEIRPNLSGAAFPWHWVIGLWPPKEDPREPDLVMPPPSVTSTIRHGFGAAMDAVPEPPSTSQPWSRVPEIPGLPTVVGEQRGPFVRPGGAVPTGVRTPIAKPPVSSPSASGEHEKA